MIESELLRRALAQLFFGDEKGINEKLSLTEMFGE